MSNCLRLVGRSVDSQVHLTIAMEFDVPRPLSGSVKYRSSSIYQSNVQQHWYLAVVVTGETCMMRGIYEGVFTDS